MKETHVECQISMDSKFLKIIKINKYETNYKFLLFLFIFQSELRNYFVFKSQKRFFLNCSLLFLILDG